MLRIFKRKLQLHSVKSRLATTNTQEFSSFAHFKQERQRCQRKTKTKETTFINYHGERIHDTHIYNVIRSLYLRLYTTDSTLYLHYSQGCLNLRQLEYHAFSMLFVLHNLYEFIHIVFPHNYITSFNSHIELTTPLSTYTWQHLFPFLTPVFIEVTYALIARI